MANDEGRPGFREWVDAQPDPGWELLPLTHITKALIAEDIVRARKIDPLDRDRLGEPVSYFYYGRPAFRANKDKVIKIDAACPICFVLDGKVVHQAKKFFAFDSGAFLSRLYKHVLIDEMNLDDFSLGNDVGRLNKLVNRTFGSQSGYLDGDRTAVVSTENGAHPWEYAARSYLELITSAGRNEPDDRICSIEVVFNTSVSLRDFLIAIVVPHTHWRSEGKSPWLTELEKCEVAVIPYNFVPGRHPEHYQSQIEQAVRAYYSSRVSS